MACAAVEMFAVALPDPRPVRGLATNVQTVVYLALTVATSGMMSFPEPCGAASETNSLQQYAHRDLRALDTDEQEVVRRTLVKLIGPGVRLNIFRPWWIWKIDAGRTRWIVFEGYSSRDIPDVSGGHVHRFDVRWKYLGSTLFPTGYRQFIRDVRLVTAPGFDRQVVLIRTYNSVHEYERERQLYAVLDDRVALVRREDHSRRILRTSYSWNEPARGPPIPGRTAEEWTQSLDSRDPFEVLASLVWLSGRHLSSKEVRQQGVSQEPVKHSRLYESVRSSAAVQNRLKRLRDSPIPWIRQAAELARKDPSSVESRQLTIHRSGSELLLYLLFWALHSGLAAMQASLLAMPHGIRSSGCRLVQSCKINPRPELEPPRDGQDLAGESSSALARNLPSRDSVLGRCYASPAKRRIHEIVQRT